MIQITTDIRKEEHKMFREFFNGLVDARMGDLTQMQRRMRKQK